MLRLEEPKLSSIRLLKCSLLADRILSGLMAARFPVSSKAVILWGIVHTASPNEHSFISRYQYSPHSD